MADGLAQVESTEGVNRHSVSIEGGWQIRIPARPLENGWVTVFVRRRLPLCRAM